VTVLVLVDHGAGNLRSLRAAFERLGADVTVSGDPGAVRAAERLVLPGVGAAAPAMRALGERGLADAIRDAVAAGSRLLGVCLGMQLLFERSAEGGTDCLGLLPGRVEAVSWARRLPHMGWNDVVAVADHPMAGGLPAVCYFAHSYAAVPANRAAVVGETQIDGRAVATVVAAGPATGVQFHPEKSGPAGRALLERWLADA
jgi:glutamine amidotransferase